MMNEYVANESRYEQMEYRRCGRTGVLLPKVSLGMWHNFGGVDDYERSRTILRHAFDQGITHLDLANNYGPPYGSAEETLGRVMDEDLRPYRDELFISTKAGYDMWPGPYGEWGSRKYLMASLNQSLKRMRLDYVDLFYTHRFDPNTPMEETLQALVDIVRQGKALYVGISNWPLEATRFAINYLRERDVPPLIYQGKLNMLNRAPMEEGILPSGRCRLHCLLTLGTGSADGPLSERYSYRLAHGSWKIPQKGDADRRTAGANPTVERRSRKQGYDAGRMGTALDTGTAGRHLCTRRSQ